MSAWYIFSALGFYPVDPVSATYVIGTYVMRRDFGDNWWLTSVRRPFYDKITIDLPGVAQPLVITSNGAPTMPYVKNVTVNGESFDAPIITHEQIASGGEIIFEMAAEPQEWASATLVSHTPIDYTSLIHGTGIDLEI